ncbi:MAG: hypothetical protein R3F59_10360 [Myxococcota bacterium]
MWHDTRNGEGRDIYMNYSSDAGDSWLGAAQRVEGDAPAAGNSLFPTCAAEGSTLHTAWYDQRSDTQGTDIYYRKANNGLMTDDEVRLDVGSADGFASTEGYANSRNPQVALAGSTVVVAWQDGRGEASLGTDNGYEELYYNFSKAGAPFDADQDYRIDSMYEGKSYKVDLNIAVIGDAFYAAWTDGRDGTSNIYFATYQVGEESNPPPLSALEDAQNQ